jgi:hypothetical protein
VGVKSVITEKRHAYVVPPHTNPGLQARVRPARSARLEGACHAPGRPAVLQRDRGGAADALQRSAAARRLPAAPPAAHGLAALRPHVRARLVGVVRRRAGRGATPRTAGHPTVFRGGAKGDADGVWNTFNATEKARRIARGEDKTILSQVLQIEQQAKMAYTAFHYVGSYQESDSARTALYFYVGDTGSGQQTRNVPLLFAVDSRGMIVEVLDSLYDAALSQLKGGP